MTLILRSRLLGAAVAAGMMVCGANAQDAADTAAEATADTAAASTVLASVNGVEITQADYERALDELGQALGNVPEAQRRTYIMSYLTDLEVISQHAKEQGLDQDEAYKTQMEFLGKQAMTEIFLDRAGQEGVTEETMRSLYEDAIGSAEPEVEVRARHILVETEEEAAEVVEQLEADTDFEELAQEKSQDPGSAENGGDLGYFTRERMVPEFAEAAFAMEAGDISDPVESQFGWHVIRVEDKREVEKPTFEEVEGQLRQLAERNAQSEAVAELREAAEIEIMDPQAGAGDAPAVDVPTDAVPEAETDAPAEDAN